MTKGFFRERKHYSLQEITDNLINLNMEETRRIVGILKKYGVVKAVKKNKPDFDDLLNEDIVLTDVIDNSSDIEYIFDYVGVVVIEGQVFKCYPKYIKSTEHLFENLKQVLKVIKKYNASEQLIYLFNGEDDSKIFNRLAVSIHLLETYYADGLYTNQKDIIETNGEGEILWDKTINETFAIIQNNKPYYVELQTKNTIDNDYDYFRRLHECVLTQCSRELSDAGLLELFELTEVELTQEDLSDFGDASYILYRLQSEIQTQYITRKQNLLKTIYTYIANEKTDKNDVSYSLYGTNSFNLVWEKVCADNFGSVLDKKIVDLPLSNPEWIKVEYKDKTLRKVIKSPRWRKTEFPDVEDPKVKTLKPDLVCIYPVDEQKKDYCFGIYDAKYYCIDYQIHGDKAIISGQPGVGDVTKQYLYQLAFDDFIMKQGYRYVQNMFFCPDEIGDKQYGWVQMEILNHIGNKRLENIAVVKLCASKMYQLYLDNQTISEHEINQYIPDIGRQEISEQKYKDKTLRKVIKSPRWRKTEFPDVEDPKVKTLKPDLVCIYPVDEQKKDYCFGIYDAKYYCIDYQIHGDKAIISGQPGVGDVTKQYLYQLAFDDFIMKQGYRYVQNMFFCPDEIGDKQYGWVQMEILNHIGNKRLENIAVVKLCASKMYQLYLDNQTISEHEINQYIPDIGRQEISEQNFANRMLAYLMRITNASKMAEEKLEMKAEQGKLIYPRQIKRELGAKIIYDAICPVASKAFYGFNPYEKENYGNMVAEDIGNSYGRCNQIADASIEIEKKIKELSEKELQNEKVIIDILRKCFEDKEDIASMAEGDNLEMLVEKVMELVRNLYL